MSTKDPWMRQCRFHTVERPMKIETAWVEERYAKVGKRVWFKDVSDTPDEVWEVVEVFARRRQSEVTKHAMDHAHQRKASDV